MKTEHPKNVENSLNRLIFLPRSIYKALPSDKHTNPRMKTMEWIPIYTLLALLQLQMLKSEKQQGQGNVPLVSSNSMDIHLFIWKSDDKATRW